MIFQFFETKESEINIQRNILYQWAGRHPQSPGFCTGQSMSCRACHHLRSDCNILWMWVQSVHHWEI